MTRPQRIQYPGATYYVTQRRKTGATIFRSDEDRNTFLKIFQTSQETYSILLHSFVLMNNHFHFLLETPKGNLSEFMRYLNISYTTYFNKKYSRSGHLYGCRYKSVLLEKESYLTPISHYLHLNPVKSGTNSRKSRNEHFQNLLDWKWSSLPGYMGLYPRYQFVHYASILNEYSGDTPRGRDNYTKAFLAHMKKGFSMKPQIAPGSIIGSPEFVRKFHLITCGKCESIEKTSQKHLPPEKVMEIIAQHFRCSPERLASHSTEVKRLTMDFLYRYCGLTNPEIGQIMELDYSSVSYGRKAICRKYSQDPKLKGQKTVLEITLSKY